MSVWLHRPFVPSRGSSGRAWHYASDAIMHVERHNCAKGCVIALEDGEANVDGFGPGGNCHVLATISVGGVPVEECSDDGKRVICHARWPLPAPQGPRPPQEETLFEVKF